MTALDGVRVLDMSRVLAGPLCGRILADLGAEVIKVESPAGDDARLFGPFTDAGDSTFHRLLNRGKFGITLDLKDPADRERFAQLVARSDVLIENFRPGVLDRLGFPPDELLRLNPRLVAVAISGFGRTGPLADRPAYDLIVQAMSGLMSVTGPDGGPGVRVGISVGDVVPALYAAVAVLSALHQRGESGGGQHIDVSMFDGLVSVLESVAMRALHTDEEISPSGGHHAISAPYGTFAVKDGTITIAVASDALFARLADVLDRPGWLADDRYASDAERGRNRVALQHEIEAALADVTHEEALERLAAAGVPCGPVLGVREALSHPHTLARGLVVDEPDGFRTLAGGVRTTGTVGEFRPAPAPGEHDHLLARWLAEEPRAAVREGSP
ncbi:CaiB/BaiF CoA transferase family protein [Actinomadura syzygii]|uniref:CoA transferase n=1 Tax=Actinomadura syzygii TaxID=1427538 RepID=A0A5D0U937_9ACTN|nr:CoA transferase [Actinomadura syzygii]TYC14514.1 CoA transferase [Actinomadura syzygii]